MSANGPLQGPRVLEPGEIVTHWPAFTLWWGEPLPYLATKDGRTALIEGPWWTQRRSQALIELLGTSHLVRLTEALMGLPVPLLAYCRDRVEAKRVGAQMYAAQQRREPFALPKGVALTDEESDRAIAASRKMTALADSLRHRMVGRVPSGALVRSTDWALLEVADAKLINRGLCPRATGMVPPPPAPRPSKMTAPVDDAEDLFRDR